MTQFKRNDESDDVLIERIRKSLDTSLKNISYAQQHEMRQIRSLALKENQPKPILKWALIISALAFSLFIFWYVQMPEKTTQQMNVYSVENLVSDEYQVWQEDAELLDNLEFYSWLAVEENQVEEKQVEDKQVEDKQSEER